MDGGLLSCNEPMEITSTYGLAQTVSPMQMDYTSIYGQQNHLDKSLLQTPKKRTTPAPPSSKTPLQQTADELRSRKLEQTTSLTMAFNATVFSKNLKQLLTDMGNRKYSNARDFDVQPITPEEIQLVDFEAQQR